jgi:hypothetical protein
MSHAGALTGILSNWDTFAKIKTIKLETFQSSPHFPEPKRQRWTTTTKNQLNLNSRKKKHCAHEEKAILQIKSKEIQQLAMAAKINLTLHKGSVAPASVRTNQILSPILGSSQCLKCRWGTW